jgi:phosphatidylglycerophosphate synthase
VLTVRMGPLVGLIVQILLLAILAALVGLSVPAWLAAVAYGLALWALLTHGLERIWTGAFGPANWVTLSRATLVGCVIALTVDSFDRNVPAALLVAIAAVALVLDAVDGKVARRTGTSSAFGARFDMEIDSVLVLVLSVYVARSAGVWVLALGAMRYAFWGASLILPWMRTQLPPRYWRKVVAACEGIVLVLAIADVLPTALTIAALLVALALLIESFGRDVVWQWQHRDVAPDRSPESIPRHPVSAHAARH